MSKFYDKDIGRINILVILSLSSVADTGPATHAQIVLQLAGSISVITYTGVNTCNLEHFCFSSSSVPQCLNLQSWPLRLLPHWRALMPSLIRF